MWIIVIIVILMLMAIFSWLGTQIDIFKDVFNGNIYTILALISAAIGGIYFWASSKSFEDYKIKEKLMKLFDNGNSSSDLPAKREIDLASVDLQSLVGDMKQMLTSPTPIFFKGWGNKRLELDVKRIGLMNEYIQNVIATGQSFIRLKADSLISYEKIQLLAETELNDLKRQAAVSKYNLRLLEDKYQNELVSLRTDTEKMKLSLKELELQYKITYDNHEMSMRERESMIQERESFAREREAILQMQSDKIEVELYCMKLKSQDDSKIKNKVSELFDKIIKDLQLDNLSPSQVLILISIFGNGNVSNIEDFEMKKKLLDEEIDKMRQENIIKKHEAQGKFYDIEHKKYKYEKERMSFG